MKKEDLLFVINKKSRSKWGDKEFKKNSKVKNYAVKKNNIYQL